MRSFEFCEHFPPLWGSLGRLVEPSLGKGRFIENFAQERGQGGLPLGSLLLWGREGVNLTTTTEDFLNNSLIEDFTRPKKRTIKFMTPRCRRSLVS